MKKLAILVITLFTLSLSGCSWFEGGDSMSKSGAASASDVDSAIKDAESAIKKAASVDGLWRDTQKKILKKAKAAAAKGDNAAAMKLAKEAEFEAEMGYKQAEKEKDAKPWLF